MTAMRCSEWKCEAGQIEEPERRTLREKRRQ